MRAVEAPRSVATPGERVVVWSTVPLLMSGVFVLFALAGIGATYVQTVAFGVPSGVFVGSLVWGTLVFGGAFFAGVFLWAPRSIELSDAGVVFRVAFRRLTVPWPDLVPPRRPFHVGILFRYRLNGLVNDSDFMPVGRKQARAILTHPRCPPMDLSPEVLKSIGLAADWRHPAA